MLDYTALQPGARASDAIRDTARALDVAPEGQVRVPDLLGKGARASVLALHQQGLSATLAGSGAVVEQSPEPGKLVARGAIITLMLKRPVRDDDKAESRGDKDSTLAAVTEVVP